MSNRLKHETSPYLLQHAENPVDWFPWGDEAFLKAKTEDKPIFLSIGYSTCHWCHVMARESFEDSETAKLLNENFVSIKVDREERPDIDSIYMSVCQAFTGSGGWPMSIFMTPDQKPFFAGTYFPKRSRGRMYGLCEILKTVSEKWETDRETLLQESENIVRRLNVVSNGSRVRKENLPENAVGHFKQIYDEKYGGFGNAPKFPTPHNLMFLLAYYERFGDEKCLRMAEHTLTQMYKGGLFDHIGFGFCRYSTDKYFLVPHFEKMLYDNALLIMAYCKAYSITKNKLYLETAEKTASYVLREMTSSSGAFFSAQDADSEGEEGKYYLLTPDEIINLFGTERGNAFNDYFGITKSGNFEGKNIPNLLHRTAWDKTFDSLLPSVDEYRKSRHSLNTDDKILAAWNSLMISALCMLYRAGGNAAYLNSAMNCERFISENLCENNKIVVSYRNGQRGVDGFLDDYAGYINALISLYGATLDNSYLERAKMFCSKVISDFSANNSAGYYLYGNESERLILRPKETYDGAIPSGNSLMALNLVRLSQLTGDENYVNLAERQLDFMSSETYQYPSGSAMYLLALLEYNDPPIKIVAVLGDISDKTKLPVSAPSDAIVRILTEPTEDYPFLENKTTFYICRDHACLIPTNDWEELK